MQFFALISEITELDPECKQERLGTNSTPGSSPKCREIICKYLKSLNTLTSLQKGSRKSFRSEHRNKNKTKKNTYQQNNSTPNEANTSIPYQWGPTREEISKHFCPTLCSIGAWCGAIICDIPCVHYSLLVPENHLLTCIHQYKRVIGITDLLSKSWQHFQKWHHLVYQLLQLRILLNLLVHNIEENLFDSLPTTEIILYFCKHTVHQHFRMIILKDCLGM